MPTVSVIIPTYNRAAMLAHAVKSILVQTFDDFEVIVIDDGSTDNTSEMMAGFTDPRIRYIFQENAGVSAARNNGIKVSRGKYISLLDSDDIILERSLETSVAVLEKHLQVAFTYGKAYLMDEKQRIFGIRKQREKRSYIREGREEIRKAIFSGNHIPTSTIVVRRRCIEEIGFFNQGFQFGSEDFDLWVRLASKYQVGYIARPLIIYRVHPNSMSRTQRLTEIEKNNNIIFNKIFEDPDLGPYFLPARDTSSLRMYLRLAGYAFGNRDMKNSRRYLSQALRLQPRWFVKRLWIPFIFRFAVTCFPSSILDSVHSVKRFLKVLLMHISRLRFRRLIPDTAAYG